MGNVSGKRDGAADPSSGVNKNEEEEGEMEQQYMDFALSAAATAPPPPGLFPADTMVPPPPPPHAPMTFLSPLTFSSQVPVVPLQRSDEIMQIQSHELMQTTVEFEDDPCKPRLPTMLTWAHGGKQVAVEGSWDNWTTKEPMQKWGDQFVAVKVLPSGVYHYRFIVDGEWTYAPDLPWTQDDIGHISNILDLQDYVPEAVESRSVFESPSSPESSYNNTIDESFFDKDPPFLPPQLHLTVLNVPTTSTDQSLPRPQHSALNHLYVQERTSDPSVLTLGSTLRFHKKYVTLALYKPSGKCKRKKSSQWS